MKKNKKIIIGAISALAVVSVSAIGFSSWIVGVEKKSAETTITAEVDDVKNKSIYLTASVAENTKVTLAEKAEHPKQGTDIIGTGEGSITANPDALSFSFTDMKLIVGNGVTAPTTINVSLSTDDGDNSFITVTDEKADKINKRTGESYTYLNLDVDLTLATDFTSSTSDDGLYTTYTLTNKKVSFTWGSFFGNTEEVTTNTPVSYYNTTFKGESNIENLMVASTNIGTELTNMNKAFAGQNIVVKVSVVEDSTL